MLRRFLGFLFITEFNWYFGYRTTMVGCRTTTGFFSWWFYHPDDDYHHKHPQTVVKSHFFVNHQLRPQKRRNRTSEPRQTSHRTTFIQGHRRIREMWGTAVPEKCQLTLCELENVRFLFFWLFSGSKFWFSVAMFHKLTVCYAIDGPYSSDDVLSSKIEVFNSTLLNYQKVWGKF